MNSDSRVPPTGSAAETLLDPGQLLLENNVSREASARLLAIYKVGQLLFEKRDPDEVVHTIQSAVVEHLDTDYSCILRVDRKGSHEIVSKQNGDGSQPWTVSHTILDRVRQTRCSALVTDTHDDPTVTDASSIRSLRIRSVMCVPIGTAPIRGLIYADRRGRQRLFHRTDLEFLTALALYARLAIDLTEDYRLTERALEIAHHELLRHEIVGRSRDLWKAFDSVTRLAKAGRRVLLRGETGVGKDLFARAYYKNSARNGKPFVKVSVPALSTSLVESELFGYVRGAFTGAVKDRRGWLEQADGGVLFLDEVADIDKVVQPKLLRFLDETGEFQRVGDTKTRYVDALVVSATSQPIETWVEEDRFREDLLARLGLVIEIPPLRERKGDIPLLVRHYLDRCGPAGKKKEISDEAMTILEHHHWPGNIRRLQQIAEYVVYLVDEDVIRPEHLPVQFNSGASTTSATPPLPEDEESIRRLRRVVQEVEVEYVRRALRATGNNRVLAMKRLDVSKDKFYKILERAGLHQKHGRENNTEHDS